MWSDPQILTSLVSEATPLRFLVAAVEPSEEC
jgi:hypothetical protein